MPSQSLCAAPTVPSLCGGIGCRSLPPQSRGCIGRPSAPISVSVAGLLVRRPWVTPTDCSSTISACIAEKTDSCVRGKMRTTLIMRTNQKRWVVRSSNAEQGQEISEEKSNQSSQEDNGPPVLTIIAGLFVLLLVLWVLSSFASWIVGLILK